MRENDILIFVDIDQTLISSAIRDFTPSEPAISKEFWNRINSFATLIILSKRPTPFAWIFKLGMRRRGWQVPDHLKGTYGWTKINKVWKWIEKTKPKISIFIGNNKDDCLSALANGCYAIRYTKHDKSEIPDNLEERVFSSDDSKLIEKHIEDLIRENGLWID